MKHSIPDHILDEIRSRADIVEIISDVVQLKKAGNSMKGLCPFHSEKSPSFSVSPDKQVYHCFGCGAGGNVFRFVMETQDLSFFEAVQNLAQRVHVTIPSPSDAGSIGSEPSEKEKIRKVNQQARQFYENCLSDPKMGSKALDYLKKRGFDRELLARYQIGYAPSAWSALQQNLEKKQFTDLDFLENAGLLKKSAERNNYYDRFRDRVIFPLKDMQGVIIGFAGRAISDDNIPKYLNSPETPLYKKSKFLFGLDIAKTAIRRENHALLVEGYFDQMRAVQNDILNVAATCGTALTPLQIQLLKNFSTNVTLVFDSDAAGQAAAEKGFDLLLSQGMNVKILCLPDGHDPDSYILKFGKESFLQEVRNAKPFLESYIIKAIAQEDTSSPNGRANVAKRVLPLIAQISNSVERVEWTKFLSEKAKLDERALMSELRKKFHSTRPQPELPKETQTAPPNPELYLIHLLMSGNETTLRTIRSRVSVGEFQDPQLRQIAQVVYEMIDASVPVLLDRALDKAEDPETARQITQIGLAPIEFEDQERAAADCIQAVKRSAAEGAIKELKRQRNHALEAGQMQESRELQIKLRNLETALKAG
ncbi:MAG: DNA primase [Candidatus Nitrohelix vancouverensis]|uniref:DNA primase n=1 Tax=Candidatus Nitrohelix vancouverensis TaxID=2705534 RepID=A0A7T0G4R4_9BACT|nr:MAG: DNA primase [Candidatus Nitrohelix vancouverensis]